jgi:ribose 5-phosphate isomerase B
MKIAVGSDERTAFTDAVIADLQKRGHQVELYGPLAGEAMAWPAVGQVVAERVAAGACQQGVLFCWTGTGVSIAANKVPGVRAALCADAETARGARLWNHANVLVLSLRATSQAVATEILDAWFATPWGDKPEDVDCVAQVAEIERKYGKEEEQR